jgi:hypothetical protein
MADLWPVSSGSPRMVSVAGESSVWSSNWMYSGLWNCVMWGSSGDLAVQNNIVANKEHTRRGIIVGDVFRCDDQDENI